MLRTLLWLSLLVPLLSWSQTNDLFAPLDNQQSSFLPEAQAFAFEFVQQNGQLHLSWQVAPGYYLYKKQFKLAVSDAELGEGQFPPGEQIEDEFFGLSEVYFTPVTLTYPIIHAIEDAVVKVRYQGCAEAGFCYPPTTQVVYLQAVGDAPRSSPVQVQSDSYQLASLLTDWRSNNQSLIWVLGGFLLLGIGLAFTPCVFPMYPIVSALVVGQGARANAVRSFRLTSVYVLGMALAYSLLGLLVAAAGFQFQVALQHPLVLWLLAGVFVFFALSMFGVITLQLPSSWQTRLHQLSNQQSSGSYPGVLLMGALSGLVLSPCTTAPLSGILLFIAQTGDQLLGFVALLVLSIGMGLPLILFAVTGGKWLPKAGAWMDKIKHLFGFMLLAVAISFVERVWVTGFTPLLWPLLVLALLGYAYWQNQATADGPMRKLRSLFILAALLGSLLYSYEQVRPLLLGKSSVQSLHPQFMKVKNLQDFQQKLATAKDEGKSVMLDLYADWCVACKQFEKYTFSDPRVQQALDNSVWMQIDLTDNTPDNLAFQQHFKVLGLPTILLFDQQGNELSKARVTGFMDADRFAQHVNLALGRFTN